MVARSAASRSTCAPSCGSAEPRSARRRVLGAAAGWDSRTRCARSSTIVVAVVGAVEVNVFVLVAAAAMGTLAATAAALAPARAAGKMSAVEALAGRTPPPRPPGRVAALGVLVLAVGGGITAWGTVGDDGVLTAAGLVGMLVGILLAIPMLVSFVGKLANHLPTTARSQRASGSAWPTYGRGLAAAVIALGATVAIATYSLSEETFEVSRRASDRISCSSGDDQLPADKGDAVVTAVERRFRTRSSHSLPGGSRGHTEALTRFTHRARPTRRQHGTAGSLFVADAAHCGGSAGGRDRGPGRGKALVLGGYTTDATW